MSVLIFTDHVLEKIGHKIAAHTPERGGALLGFPNSNLITHFIDDPDAQTSFTSYFPSSNLTNLVQAKEKQSGMKFMGVIHSHPGEMNHPSGQDLKAFKKGLDINPDLPYFVAPIVTTKSPADPNASNEIDLEPRGKITTYFASRVKDRITPGNVVTINNIQVVVMPIQEHINQLIENIVSDDADLQNKAFGTFEINGVFYISATLQFRSFELIILFPPNYPISSPFMIKTINGNSYEVGFNWKVFSNEENSLVANCSEDINNLTEE